ncbi:hypothetical protein [Croceibacter atlanticus]|uniref:hypothetical protein n=1 Tax=Croceibacter atlanticus TaxID=313588 RepID=UPI0024935164|nr:hypothetical protein [Croceibacter atlanticus]
MKDFSKNVIGIDVGSLQSIIRQAVAKELQHIKDFINPVKEDEELWTRQQTCDFLQISLVTLWQITRDGLLVSRRIKSKPMYLKSDVMHYLKEVA